MEMRQDDTTIMLICIASSYSGKCDGFYVTKVLQFRPDLLCAGSVKQKTQVPRENTSPTVKPEKTDTRNEMLCASDFFFFSKYKKDIEIRIVKLCLNNLFTS